MTRPPVLVVIDDEPNTLSLIERAVRPEGYKTILHASAREALAALGAERPDVALVDLQMPEIGGLDVLRAIRRIHPECGVILMSASASPEAAIEAVKLGALDCVAKPIDIPRLRRRLADVKEEAERRAEILASDSATAHRLELCGMIGRSAVMQELFDLVRRIAPHARAALVTGEHGTGKQAIARAIHELGPRRSKRFATLICSAVTPLLIESELFGHVRGAFTDAKSDRAGAFEVADGGTLFLDEVGNMPLPQQAKLLRVLQTGEFNPVGSSKVKKSDVRVIAATNARLADEVSQGRFREDLLYRLNTVEIQLPPLRERTEDIPQLAQHFLGLQGQRYGKKVTAFSRDALEALVRHPWPGNVRELEHAVERAVLMARDSQIAAEDLVLAPAARRESAQLYEAMSLDEAEKVLIQKALGRCGGNVTDAARELGVSRSALYRRLQHHGLKAQG
ncbi:MAG: sigma-54-dependent transcriptional regulator [Myxococcales bacterium]